MRTDRRITLLVLAAALGCEGRDLPVAPAPSPPLAQIVDGAHNGGNSHLYFLSPLVRPSPSPSGTLDAGLLPHLAVRICALDADGQCASVVATFTSDGEGPAKLRIENDEQLHFHVNWQTRQYQLDPATDYRITVLAAGTELGYADVDVVSHPRGLTHVAAGSVRVLNGQTLPIKFLVLEGGVFVIGTAGGTITAFGGAVTLVIPANGLSGNSGLTIEPASDLPTEGAAFVLGSSAYDFGPDGLTFDSPARLTLAYDEAKLPAGREEHELALLHFVDGSWQGVLGSVVNVEANTVTGPITGFSPYAVGGGTLVTLSGFGIAVIDGFMHPAEWADADCRTFQASLPLAGTTPATVCVMNDPANLYVGVNFAQSDEAGIGLFFDNLDDGPTAGDDVVVASYFLGVFEQSFDDQFMFPTAAFNPPRSDPSCEPPDLPICSFPDTSHAGHQDGRGAFQFQVFPGGLTTYEMVHPLNSADNAHDFSLAPGDIVGFRMDLVIGDGVGGGPGAETHTLFPDTLDHGHIFISKAIDQHQPIVDAQAGGGVFISTFQIELGGATDQILAQVVTAGISGTLVQVRVPVECDADLVVEIQGVTNGEPNGTVLASQVTTAANFPPIRLPQIVFRPITFANPPAFTAGQQFAIVLKNVTAGAHCAIFRGPVGDPYPGGEGFFDALPNQGVWTLLGARHDLPFQTVVQ